MNASIADEGLSSAEARARLSIYGPNSIADADVRPFRRILEKFFRPCTMVARSDRAAGAGARKIFEAAVILALLIFNAVIGFFQESRAQATLAALKSRLSLTASVRRDRVWTTIPAAQLVPGDVIKLSLGGVVAADVRISGGDVLLDQSMLTGESVPIDAGAGQHTYAGALIRRGEATAQVMATGRKTKFGRTAELIKNAHVVSSQQSAVFRVVRNLAACNGVLISFMLVYATWTNMPSAK
jgi:H+-transporting ATPase